MKVFLKTIDNTHLGQTDPNIEFMNCSRNINTSSGNTHNIWKNRPILAINAITFVSFKLFKKF